MTSSIRSLFLLLCLQTSLALICNSAFLSAPGDTHLMNRKRHIHGVQRTSSVSRRTASLLPKTGATFFRKVQNVRHGRVDIRASGGGGETQLHVSLKNHPLHSLVEGFQVPPKEIADLVEAPPPPRMIISPPLTGCKYFAKMQQDSMLTLHDLAEPEEKLAGLRFDPILDVPSRHVRGKSLTIVCRETGKETPVQGIPDGGKFSGPTWSPDGHQLAFTVLFRDRGLYLYILDPANPVARLVTERRLSAVCNAVYEWCPSVGNKTTKMIVNAVPSTRGPPPSRDKVPKAPSVQMASGGSSPSRTLQDLLQDEHDDALFEHYTTTQLVEVNLDTREERIIGPPAMHCDMDISPDGRFLMTKIMQKPFSRHVYLNRFEVRYDVWSLYEKDPKPKTIVTLPRAENIPIGRDACRAGCRAHTWAGNEPSTLMWIEALDGGDPKTIVPHRDVLYKQEFPLWGAPQELLRTQYRMQSIWWGEDGFAVLRENDYKTRISRMWQINTKMPSESPKEPLLEYDSDDRYNHPGTPVTFRKVNNKHLLKEIEGGKILMTGTGGSDDGDRPFLDKRGLYGDVKEKNTAAERLWQCDKGVYEEPICVLAKEKGGWTLLTSRETQVDVPNVWEIDLATGARKQVTFVEHPQPAILGVQAKMIKYKRNDGVDLSGMLYLPADYTIGERRLPTLLWAYPQEFKNASSASQVQGSPHRFIRVSPMSPLLWVMRGYAVLDDPAMPIVGENGKEENDDFIPQLVSSAEAAVEELKRVGVTDDRVAVGGHSYGAFMTANLLAHSKIFKAGIGRSGAYNRLLTPFGFQSEERTLWEAPDVYLKMSPFMHADKMDAPLLLIHGESDDNPGTFPLQSERLFQALRGLGKKSRLCILPLESHAYAAKESILHMCWEMNEWLEHHLDVHRD